MAPPPGSRAYLLMFHVKQPPRDAFPSEPGCCRTRLTVGKLSGDGSPGESSTLAHPLSQRASRRLRPTAARVRTLRTSSLEEAWARAFEHGVPATLQDGHRTDCMEIVRIAAFFTASEKTEPIGCPASRVASECPAIRRVLHSCLISASRVRSPAICIALSAHLHCVSKPESTEVHRCRGNTSRDDSRWKRPILRGVQAADSAELACPQRNYPIGTRVFRHANHGLDPGARHNHDGRGSSSSGVQDGVDTDERRACFT